MEHFLPLPSPLTHPLVHVAAKQSRGTSAPSMTPEQCALLYAYVGLILAVKAEVCYKGWEGSSHELALPKGAINAPQWPWHGGPNM